jgi:asparagine synthase (glutamine-hydrolysing)
MPGIVGFVTSKILPEDKPMLDAMVKTMVHESFYTSGTLIEESLGVAVGWTVHADTFSDCQPIWNERRDICLIFTGEDFTDAPVVDALRAKGHEFSRDNASYLVHLYEENGPSFLEKVNGWFSGVLLDLRERKMVLFNDRYAASRVYFHENERGFYFASEAKALLKVLPKTRQLDLKSLGEYISCGCVMQNRSFFTGVSLMPGGAEWTFSPGMPVRKATYFKRESWEEQPLLSPEKYFEKLDATWQRILPRYFRGKEAVALSLTGGVDSRLILACAPRAPGTLPCYTFGGSYRDCADVTVSQQIAKYCQQPHQTIPLASDFLEQFPALAEKTVYVTDGTLDVSGAVDIYANRIARKIAPVRVTGLNGGEILRSLTMFKPWSPCLGLLSAEFLSHVNNAAATYASELQGHGLSFIAFKQSAWHLYPRLASERAEITIRSPYFDNELVALAFQAPPEMRTSDPALRIIANAQPILKKVGTDRASRLDAIPGLTQLRHQFQEFTFKAEYAYDYGMPQWVAKVDHMLSPLHLEKLFLGRHKFHHFRVWYRDKLGAYVREVMLDPRSRNRGYLDGAFLEQMVGGHLKGNRNYTTEIHRLMTVELLQRQLIEQGATPSVN